MIKKVNSKWVLYTHDGKKKLGTFSTKSEAEKREREINYFKRKK